VPSTTIGSELRRARRSPVWDVITDPDLQCVCLFALIGLLLARYLGRIFPLDDNTVSAIALLS
jgi:hypothetical protein